MNNLATKRSVEVLLFSWYALLHVYYQFWNAVNDGKLKN